MTASPDDGSALDPAFLDIAQSLADRAGEILKPRFRAPVAVETKADRTPVTEADRAVETALATILSEVRPQDGLIGEEFGARPGTSRYTWVLDPIDGTKAFLSGRPLFVTLIAVLEGDRPVLGVIDQPILGERWVGASGHPTTFNGAPARAVAVPDPTRALIGATDPFMFRGGDAVAFERVRSRAAATVWGGDGYLYGLVASGHMDAAVEADLKLHDFAALVPVVTGAGGQMTDWRGAALGPGSDGRVIASGDAGLHARLVALLSG